MASGSVLAVDPGNAASAYCLVDLTSRKPVEFGKIPNWELRTWLGKFDGDRAVIEMVASYGMAVGADVFETCVWIGRFAESLRFRAGVEPDLVKRLPVKMHHCKSAKAKDTNIRQALVDRFAPGQANNGKGTKADPGWFYGFAADVWAAYALGVYAADLALKETP